MKRLIYLLALVLVAASCSEPAGKLSISGNISNLPDGKVYVSLFDTLLQATRVDTFEIVDGHFDYESSFELAEPECIMLGSTKGNPFLVFFAGHDDVVLDGNMLAPDDIVIEGSESQDILEVYQNGIPDTERMNSLLNEYRTTTHNVDAQAQIMEEIRHIRENQNEYLKQQLIENKQNTIAPFLLCNTMNVFSFEFVDSMTQVFEQYNREHKYVRALRKYLELAQPNYEAQQRIQIGKLAPDFQCVSVAGDSISLSSLRGKKVFLDFWASWCRPCRKNNKTIVELNNKFADKGIQIVCVSVDSDRDAWLEAVDSDQLPGIQLIDLDRSASNAYCIREIPSSFLIDENGVIEQRDVSLEKLFPEISK